MKMILWNLSIWAAASFIRNAGATAAPPALQLQSGDRLDTDSFRGQPQSSPYLDDQYLPTVPTTPFTPSSSGEFLSLHSIEGIVVDPQFSATVNHAGKTLIPPSLYQFAKTFQGDVSESLGLDLPVLSEASGLASGPFIFLTLEQDSSKFLDAAGRETSEGYTLTIGEDGITIAGASPLGVWWGTRTLLQAAVLKHLVIPYGSGTDAPGWGSRGAMLDAGRHYYPPEFLIEMCAYLSYFKQNEFHVHLSDNMFNYDPDLSRDKVLDVYSSVRLLSDDPALAGLARLANESYTKEQFDDVQHKCASRGVTVIPEIEAPAHALAIVRWKPELALDGDFSMLNLSHPDTIPTLKSIWKTFLPWFHSKTVSIGADEYSSNHVQDYTRYVDELSEFIRDTASKDIRIWGTFPPSKGGTVTKNVAIQHWASFEDNAYFDFIKNGYQVLNSDLSAYIVLKFSPWFMQGLNKTWIFHGNPDGSAFAPNIFDPRNATNNPTRNHSLLLGHVAALWNDWGWTASTALEAYWAWRDTLPALADKQWGGKILEEEYDAVFPKLHAAIPGQNLDRSISSKSDIILEYGFGDSSRSTQVVDTSGNGYHGTLHGGCIVTDSTLHLTASCYVQTPLLSKGRDYTLSFSVKPASDTPGTLFSGPDSVLMSGYSSYSNVTMLSGGHPYALNYTLPTDTWTHVKLSGRGNTTLLTVSGAEGGVGTTHTFNSRVAIGHSDNGVESAWLSMAFEAPLARIGGNFTGLIKDVSLKATA